MFQLACALSGGCLTALVVICRRLRGCLASMFELQRLRCRRQQAWVQTQFVLELSAR